MEIFVVRRTLVHLPSYHRSKRYKTSPRDWLQIGQSAAALGCLFLPCLFCPMSDCHLFTSDQNEPKVNSRVGSKGEHEFADIVLELRNGKKRCFLGFFLLFLDFRFVEVLLSKQSHNNIACTQFRWWDYWTFVSTTEVSLETGMCSPSFSHDCHGGVTVPPEVVFGWLWIE